MVRLQRRLLAAAPLLALALAAAGLSHKEIIALARKKFPAVMNRKEPARYLVMVFDSTDRYRWGFPVKGGVMVNVGADTLTPEERLAREMGTKLPPPPSERVIRVYTTGFPSGVRDSTRALVSLPTNTDDGLIPTTPKSEESGIDGVFARNVRLVERIAMFPGEDEPLRLDILAVHLVGVIADTGRPVRTTIPHVLPPSNRPATAAGIKKKASVKALVMLPMPIPDAVLPYELNACFDVAPNGDAKLLSWTESRDLDYNGKIKKSLAAYRFRPATLDGVAVRDTTCIRAKPFKPRV